ncbi:toll-like receptor 13 [Polypterus senegalus]|uniref:toll-like receptor 13 n=1 Tax=Polypterus senegalus TaxID=55291 RepID=UPI0019644978|nr:toll-like receptor 13 [Polypterus senegalus]
MRQTLVTLCFCLVMSVESYSFNHCTVKRSHNNTFITASCIQMNFHVVPRDIPDQTNNLDLSQNTISQLVRDDFKNLIFLKVLNVSGNHISRMANGTFKDLVALEVLNLSKNNISSLSDATFEGLASLVTLHLGENQIRSIGQASFQGLTSVRLVNLSFNGLCDLERLRSVLEVTHLRKLYIANNNIGRFSTDCFPNASLQLNVLDVSRNPLSLFNVKANRLTSLQTLDLSFLDSTNGLQWEVSSTALTHTMKRLYLSQSTIAAPGLLSILQTMVNSSVEYLKVSHLNLSQVPDVLQKVCLWFPKLQILYLQGNNFVRVQGTPFVNCTRVTSLELSWNGLEELSEGVFNGLNQLRRLFLSHNLLQAVPNLMGLATGLETLDLRNNQIEKIHPKDFAQLRNLRYLNLVGNKITAIQSQDLDGLHHLEQLKLGNNLILDIPEPFSSSLRNLRTLELFANKMSALRKGTFRNLRSLVSLKMADNQISQIEDGSFQGLSKLKVLYLGGNKIAMKMLITWNVFGGLSSLRELQVFDNELRCESDDDFQRPPFSGLKDLTSLYFNSQRDEGLLNLPANSLQGLPSLKRVYANNLNLNFIHPDTFTYTPHLQFLELTGNPLGQIHPSVFHSTPNLRVLYLDSTRVQSLDFLIHTNLTELQILTVASNEISAVNETHIRSLPKLNLLSAEKNPFTCSCENAWFLNWSLLDPQVQVTFLNTFTCSHPANYVGMKLVDFKTDLCLVDYEFVGFISSFSIVAVTMVAASVYHYLRWQVAFVYYYFMAFLYDRRQRAQPLQAYEYDAFVSYNRNDELWVLKELIPNLEEKQGWKLCLHHRDFEPGKAIVENIVDSIYRSRKTICLISRHFLESEWCSREMQVASVRLMDEKEDVLVLVFLEDLPSAQLSPYHRMRKLVKRKTYLKWPQNREEENLFWHKLKTALSAKEELCRDHPIALCL